MLFIYLFDSHHEDP